MRPEQARQAQARRFAAHLGVDGDAMFAAAMAVWGNLNPRATTFDQALSVAGAVLTAIRPDPGRPAGDGEHLIELNPSGVVRLRDWLAHPDGALVMGRAGFEAVPGGGILVRTGEVPRG
jgi:hypothetical protein